MKKLYTVILCGVLAVLLSACSFDEILERIITTNTQATTAATTVQKMDLGDKADLSSFVFVGDSRFVGMKNAIKGYVDGDAEFVAKVGEGLAWLKKIAPDLYKKKGKIIVFNFGVNDLHNASKYIDFYNGMPKDFMENNTLIFMTVNPVNEAKEAEHGFKVKNSDIEKFNNKMKEGLDKEHFRIIDSNTYIQLNDYQTTDGLHYFNNTYRLIFEFAVKSCVNKEYLKR